jgi:uncharacterized protein (DUF488 family)
VSRRVLYTIGHGTRTTDELIAALRGAGVRAVADVRAHPRSLTNPQFNRDVLGPKLAGCGIAYAHWSALGGRRRGLGAASPNVAWKNAGFRGFADYMLTDEFWFALDDLLVQAAARATAVMCSETLWWRCHRRMIADAATARGAEVAHIMKPGVVVAHVLSPAARIAGNRVSYL